MAQTFDLVITGGEIVTAGAVSPATVAIREGRIAALLGAAERPDAGERLDATGLHILPGVIDTHVHTRHPGDATREDFVSGTSAAAAGGITMILEMPISRLAVHSGASLAERARLLAGEAIVDFALYGGAGHQNLATIDEQAAAGAVAFKTFLQTPPPSRAPEFTGQWCTDAATLRDVMAAVARTGVPHAFHCEHEPMLLELQRRLEADGRLDGLAHAESRPPVVEAASVAMVLALAAEAGGPVHVVHLSSPLAAELVKEARRRGLAATAETCPPYLFLTTDALRVHGPFAKCNPALRSEDEVDALWAHVVGGTIDVIGTDHSPFLEAEKARGWTNIFQAPPGLAGLEILVPLMLTAVQRGRVDLPAVARLLSERAAELFRLPGKGPIAPGRDADLTIVDCSTDWTFDSSRCLTKSKASMRAFDGMRLRGRVVSTIVRGVRVFDDGAILVRPGHGRFVRPAGRRAAEPAALGRN